MSSAPENPPPKPEVAAPASLVSSVFEWGMLRNVPTPHGVYRPMANGPSAPFRRIEIHATTLQAGRTSHSPHQHPQEELILLKEGSVESWINGQISRVGADSLIFFASYDLHGLTSMGPGPATYYVVNIHTDVSEKLPAPEAPTTLLSHLYPSTIIPSAPLVAAGGRSGVTRQLVSSATTTLGLFEASLHTLVAGDSFKPYIGMPQARIMIIRDGEIELTLPTDVRTVHAGDLVYLAPNDLYCVRNVSGAPVTFFLFAFSP